MTNLQFLSDIEASAINGGRQSIGTQFGLVNVNTSTTREQVVGQVGINTSNNTASANNSGTVVAVGLGTFGGTSAAGATASNTVNQANTQTQTVTGTF